VNPRKNARGEGKLGCIFWIVVVLIVGTLMYRYIPTRIAIAELEDFCGETALHVGRTAAEDVQRSIYDRARELNLPVKMEDIKVNKMRDRIIIDVNFVNTIDLIVTKKDRQVDIHVDKPYFL
jgi:hypothetical protein